MSNIKLLVGSTLWQGWQNATITRSIDAVYSEFSLSMTLGWPEKFRKNNLQESLGTGDIPVLKIGDECTLKLDDETVVTGFINESNFQAGANGFQVDISGRDRTALLFKSSVVRVDAASGKAKSAEWLNRTVIEIARDICEPFDIKVTAKADVGKAIRKFTVEPGETAHRALERLARHRALLFYADRDGGLVFSTANVAEKAETDLIFGARGNVLSMRSSSSLSDRNQTYIFRGQCPRNSAHASAHTTVSGTARDKDVPQYSPKVVLADEPGTEKDLTELAYDMAVKNASRSSTRTYTLAHWRQGPGRPLWDINNLVTVNDVLEGMQHDLLIKRCVFNVSQTKAPETVLTVLPAYAYSLRAIPEAETPVTDVPALQKKGAASTREQRGNVQ